MANGEIQYNENKKGFPSLGFPVKISVYSVYEPLINLCIA